jgi:hypothetical protein
MMADDRALKALSGCRVCPEAARCRLIAGIRAGLAQAAEDVLREKRGADGHG